MYSLPQKRCATVSFLAPSADDQRDLTSSRIHAMRKISKMNAALQAMIPGQIGRYDDSFNANCVGDTFQMLEVPTILFEAGHAPDDYERLVSRKVIFYAFLALFDMDGGVNSEEHSSYFDIPENEVLAKDVILRNAKFGENAPQSLSIMYQELLENDRIRLEPVIDQIGDLDAHFGHQEIDLKGATILLNFYENVFVNEKVTTIVDKNSNNSVFFKDSCKIV